MFMGRKQPTFGQAFWAYYDLHAKGYLKSHKEILGLHRRYLTPLDKRCLKDISRQDIQSLHVRIGTKSGKVAANRAIEIISVVYNKAIEWEMYGGTNPVRLIKKFKLKSRERFLRRDELGRFFDAVGQLKSRNVHDFILLALYTGARSGNLLAMRWDDVNLLENEWRIRETKNGESQTIPLIEEAVLLLKARRRQGEFVFASNTKTGYMQNIRKSWYYLLKKAKITNLTVHDLRRTLGSWEARTGASLPIIGKTLCHRDPRSTSIYARLDLDPVRQAMEKAIAAMLGQ